MARLKAANNAQSLLSANITASTTSLTVADGSVFPEPPFLITIDDEIIEVGTKTGNTFSGLLRGQEGTVAAPHSSGAIVENRMTAGSYNELVDQQQFNELQNTVVAHLAEKVSDDVHGLLSGGKIIEESGNNANGSYVRFADGTQICYRYLATNLQDLSDSETWVFPAPFSNSNTMFVRHFMYGSDATNLREFNDDCSPRLVISNIRLVSQQSATVQSKFSPRALSGTNSTLGVGIASLAIGRWK